MKILASTIEKIIVDFNVRSFVRSYEHPPHSKKMQKDYGAKVAVATDDKNFGRICVISKFLLFNNKDLKQHTYKIYEYNEKGEYLDEIKYKDVGEIFFENLQYFT